MVKRWQVELLKRELKAGASMGDAARRAGLSQPTARKYRDLERGDEVMSQRGGRTREDPFAEAWTGIERMLELDPKLEAKAVFEELRERQPGRWQGGPVEDLAAAVAGVAFGVGTGQGGVFRAALQAGGAVPVGLHAHGEFGSDGGGH